MPDWRQYFLKERWLSLAELKDDVLLKVVGWGVSSDRDRPQPYLVCENQSGERLRVRVNASSFTDLDKAWGPDPETWLGKVIEVSRGRVRTTKGWTDALIVRPTNEKWEDIPF